MRLTHSISIYVLLLVGCASKGPPEVDYSRPPDLVDLRRLDAGLLFDIRYASDNNFVGRPVYKTADAYLQRPAAEALLAAQKRLAHQGLGIMVFDGYRPWRVTKLFWDITASDKKDFVADPRKGSRHNRGCAVDLTLVDLATGQPVTMPTDYDDFSPRAHIDYAGPDLDPQARRNRDRLRSAMEAVGFEVYPYEWWHYDYKDWREYPLMNISFEALKLVDPSL